MDPPPPLTSSRTVVIAGIVVNLAERLKYPLLVKLCVDGTNSHLVSLKPEETLVGDRLLQDPLNLREGSILSVKVKEKHAIWDVILAKFSLSLEHIWPAQEPCMSDDRTKKYQILLPDAKQQLWLNISMVTSSSPASSDDVGQTSPAETPEQVIGNQRATNALNDAVQSLQKFDTTFKQLGGAKLESLKVAETFGELHSTAKVVVEFVKIVHEEVRSHNQDHEAMVDLATSIETTLKFIPATEEVSKLNALKDSIPSFYELMDKTVDLIKKWLADGGISQIVNIFKPHTEIEGLKKQYNVFEKWFELGVVVDNAIRIDNVTKLQELQELETALGGIKEIPPRADPCMEGTRINLLSHTESEIDDLGGKNIVCLYGAPGSGKSSMSLTIKMRLQEQGRLVTYFRFDQNEATLTTSMALWRCVAFDLAKRYFSVLKRQLSLLRENKVNLTSTVDVFFSLINDPLSNLTEALPNHPLVIVIDALNECGGFEGRSSSARQELRKTLRRWSQLPNYFKLLVTSRDESDIAQILSDISTTIDIPSGRFLTENPMIPASVEASQDIHTFIQSRLQAIREDLSPFLVDWPGKDVIGSMVGRAAGNFMWATTALIFIESGLDPQERLERIMDDRLGSEGMERLYSLYSTILQMSLGAFSGNPEGEILPAVFGTMIFAKRPLQDRDYIKLPTILPINLNMIALIRDRLSSVIDRGQALRFVDKSFEDFLLSKDCPTMYSVNPDKTSSLLTWLCLTTMTAELHFNICGLETSCLKNVDVPDIETKVANGIPPLLSYSCCYWVDHLSRTSFNERLMSDVKAMIVDKLLYWFEAMSLLKEVGRVSDSLLSVLNWLKLGSDEELVHFIRDAHQFIREFYYPISQSAPHIYISALSFGPERSLVVRKFLRRFPNVLGVSEGSPTSWSPCIFTSGHHTNRVRSVAFSPDEKCFVSGSDDQTICICDSETGNLTSGPFKCTNWILSCFFDRDGRRVWAHCLDSQVFSWEVVTRKKHLVFQAGPGWGDVIGCCCSKGGQNIVSVSRRKGVVTLWNADTGEQLDTPLKILKDVGRASFSPDRSDSCYIAWAGGINVNIGIGNLADGSQISGLSHSRTHFGHMEPISTLSFSVDGHFVLSGSEDGTILIWDAKTGSIIGPPLVTGKTGEVHSVAYSHENRLLVSASGFPGKVMVWNTLTHEVVLGPLEGHTSRIEAIALSRDGQRALSASWDGTVRMWDLGWEGVVPGTHGHMNELRYIAFSPDGQRLASLDSETIRLWDATTGKPLVNPISTLSSYRKLIFSPDGSHLLAFGSVDGIIRAWNVNTAEPIFNHDLKNDNNRHMLAKDVAFRLTDQRLVTCSHNIVRVWTLEDGSLTEDFSASSPQPENPSQPVNLIALSPDGLIVLVRDDNRTPHHYLWTTTTSRVLSFTFTDDEDISRGEVAYSPSGRFLAAASKEGTLRVWNSQTGELVAGPSTLDCQLAHLAFSSDECHIAFSYFDSDRTAIWIWNARAGRIVSGPWKAHTDDIVSLTFSPGGEKLVSGSSGGQIGIWNTADLLGHTQASAGFLGTGTQIEDGWVMDIHGNILFWVPKDHRSGLVWSQNIGVVVGGGQTRTELDLTRFRYGENWTECFADRK